MGLSRVSPRNSAFLHPSTIMRPIPTVGGRHISEELLGKNPMNPGPFQARAKRLDAATPIRAPPPLAASQGPTPSSPLKQETLPMGMTLRHVGLRVPKAQRHKNKRPLCLVSSTQVRLRGQGSRRYGGRPLTLARQSTGRQPALWRMTLDPRTPIDRQAAAPRRRHAKDLTRARVAFDPRHKSAATLPRNDSREHAETQARTDSRAPLPSCAGPRMTPGRPSNTVTPRAIAASPPPGR